MTTRKILFFMIVGLALLCVVLVALLSPILTYRLGPPDLEATKVAATLNREATESALTSQQTATEAAIAIRATEIVLEATEVAIAATQAALNPASPTPVVPPTSSQAPPVNAPPSLVTSEGLTWNGLKIEVTATNHDAWALLKAQNQFNDPPLEGRTMLMLTVKATNVEGAQDDPVRISESDFELIGSYNVLYTTFGDQTSCGVLPDELDGVVVRDSSIEGNVCFQVPLDEHDFTLIYEQQAGNYPAIYIEVPQ